MQAVSDECPTVAAYSSPGCSERGGGEVGSDDAPDIGIGVYRSLSTRSGRVVMPRHPEVHEAYLSMLQHGVVDACGLRPVSCVQEARLMAYPSQCLHNAAIVTALHWHR